MVSSLVCLKVPMCTNDGTRQMCVRLCAGSFVTATVFVYAYCRLIFPNIRQIECRVVHAFSTACIAVILWSCLSMSEVDKFRLFSTFRFPDFFFLSSSSLFCSGERILFPATCGCVSFAWSARASSSFEFIAFYSFHFLVNTIIVAMRAVRIFEVSIEFGCATTALQTVCAASLWFHKINRPFCSNFCFFLSFTW